MNVWKKSQENQRKIGSPISSQRKKRQVTYKRTTIRLVLMSKQRWLRARRSLPDCYQQRELPPELELHKLDHALSLLLAIFLAFCMKPVLDVLTMVVFHHPSVLLCTRIWGKGILRCGLERVPEKQALGQECVWKELIKEVLRKDR